MTVRVMDGQRYFGASIEAVIRHPRSPWSKMAGRAGVQIPPITEAADVPAIPAWVNGNRWVVGCPDCGDGTLLGSLDYQFVWPAQPVMMCGNCFNGALGHKWRPVLVPTGRQRENIERILRARPVPQHRHWTPNETQKKLRAENRALGLAEEAGD